MLSVISLEYQFYHLYNVLIFLNRLVQAGLGLVEVLASILERPLQIFLNRRCCELLFSLSFILITTFEC